ncbi:MAG: hypothetical protein WC653_00210 [Candidatus Gracilibacteria bacterium]
MKKILLLSLFLLACQTSPIESDLPLIDEPETTTFFTSTVEVALVALGDGTAAGDGIIGCGDRVQMVEKDVSSNSKAGKIKAALESLFAIEGSDYGESGLYNALYQSDVTVDSVILTSSDTESAAVEVTLSGSIVSGGTCDDPRIEEQIIQTIKANAPVGSTVVATIDGKDLHEYFTLSGL